MKLRDTTDPKAHYRARTLYSENDLQKKLRIVENFHVHLISAYYSEGGAEWSSEGREESDHFHHIDLVLEGAREVIHNGKSFRLVPGQAWFLPGCTPVARRCGGRFRVYYFKIRCEWLPGVDPLLDWPERRPVCLGNWSEKTLLEEWQLGVPGREVQSLLMVQAQIQSWLASSLPAMDQIIYNHINTHGRFKPVFDLIERRLGADLRVEKLAETMRLPVSAFSMAFARSTGLSPKAYLNRRLNQEAIKLLNRSDVLVKEVADQLRFADEYYFSRFFKKLNGVPPAEYRQKILGGL